MCEAKWVDASLSLTLLLFLELTVTSRFVFLSFYSEIQCRSQSQSQSSLDWLPFVPSDFASSLLPFSLGLSALHGSSLLPVTPVSSSVPTGVSLFQTQHRNNSTSPASTPHNRSISSLPLSTSSPKPILPVPPIRQNQARTGYLAHARCDEAQRFITENLPCRRRKRRRTPATRESIRLWVSFLLRTSGVQRRQYGGGRLRVGGRSSGWLGLVLVGIERRERRGREEGNEKKRLDC